MAGKAHPGFRGAAKQVAAKEGIPLANAERIIGAAACSKSQIFSSPHVFTASRI